MYYKFKNEAINVESIRLALVAGLFLFLISIVTSGCAAGWMGEELGKPGGENYADKGNVQQTTITTIGALGRSLGDYTRKKLNFETWGYDHMVMDSAAITIMARITHCKWQWHGDSEVEVEVHSLTYSEQADYVEKTIDDTIVGTWTIQIDPQSGHILHSQWVPSKTTQ